MQIRKLKKLITLLSVIFILSSCAKDTIVPDPPVVPVPPVPGQISYAGEIQPIFTEKCVRCHGVGQVAPVLVEGKSYQALKNMPGLIVVGAPDNSIVYQKMATGGSMAAYCTKANADSVYKWISQGAKNN